MSQESLHFVVILQTVGCHLQPGNRGTVERQLGTQLPHEGRQDVLRRTRQSAADDDQTVEQGDTSGDDMTRHGA